MMYVCSTNSTTCPMCSFLWSNRCGFRPVQTPCIYSEKVVCIQMPLLTVGLGTATAGNCAASSVMRLFHGYTLKPYSKALQLQNGNGLHLWDPTLDIGAFQLTWILYCFYSASSVIYAYFFLQEIMKVRQWIRCMDLKEKSNLSILLARCWDVAQGGQLCIFMMHIHDALMYES